MRSKSRSHTGKQKVQRLSLTDTVSQSNFVASFSLSCVNEKAQSLLEQKEKKRMPTREPSATAYVRIRREKKKQKKEKRKRTGEDKREIKKNTRSQNAAAILCKFKAKLEELACKTHIRAPSHVPTKLPPDNGQTWIKTGSVTNPVQN